MQSLGPQTRGLPAHGCPLLRGRQRGGAHSGRGISKRPCLLGAVMETGHGQEEEGEREGSLCPRSHLTQACSFGPSWACLARGAKMLRREPSLQPDSQTLDAGRAPVPARLPADLPRGLPQGGCGGRPGPAPAGVWPPLLGLWLAARDAESVAPLTPLSAAVCGNFAHCPCC